MKQRVAWRQLYLQDWLSTLRWNPQGQCWKSTFKPSEDALITITDDPCTLRDVLQARWMISDVRISSSGVCGHNGEELLLIYWWSGRNIYHVRDSGILNNTLLLRRFKVMTHFHHLHQCQIHQSCCAAPHRWCSPRVLELPAWDSSDWSFLTHHHQITWRPLGSPLWGLAPEYDQSLNRSTC